MLGYRGAAAKLAGCLTGKRCEWVVLLRCKGEMPGRPGGGGAGHSKGTGRRETRYTRGGGAGAASHSRAAAGCARRDSQGSPSIPAGSSHAGPERGHTRSWTGSNAGGSIVQAYCLWPANNGADKAFGVCFELLPLQILTTVAAAVAGGSSGVCRVEPRLRLACLGTARPLISLHSLRFHINPLESFAC